MDDDRMDIDEEPVEAKKRGAHNITAKKVIQTVEGHSTQHGTPAIVLLPGKIPYVFGLDQDEEKDTVLMDALTIAVKRLTIVPPEREPRRATGSTNTATGAGQLGGEGKGDGAAGTRANSVVDIRQLLDIFDTKAREDALRKDDGSRKRWGGSDLGVLRRLFMRHLKMFLELFLDTFGLGWYTMLNNGQSLVPNLPWLTEESLRASIAEDSPYKKYFPKKTMSARDLRLLVKAPRLENLTVSEFNHLVIHFNKHLPGLVAQVFHGNYAVPSDFLRAWAPCPCKAVLVIEGRVEDRLMAAGKAMRVCSCTAIDLKGLVQGIVDSFLAARFPQLNDKQRAAISMIASSGQDSKPALIVGPAGAGKSFCAEALKAVDEAMGRVFQGVGPTGVVAAALGGQTNHSFFKVKFQRMQDDEAQLMFDAQAYEEAGDKMKEHQARKQLTKVDTLLMDEAFFTDRRMVELALLAHDKRLADNKAARTVLLAGPDQLLGPRCEPVWKSRELLGKCDIYVLSAIVRQGADDPLLEIVAAVGAAQEVPATVVTQVLSIPKTIPKDGDVVRVFCTNEEVRNSTAECLEAPEGEEVRLPSVDFDKGQLGERLKPVLASTDLEEELVFKNGARAMLLHSVCKEKGHVTGLVGTIRFANMKLLFRTQQGEEFEVPRIVRGIYAAYYGSPVAEREQYPVCLAYAVTVHKLQGMTVSAMLYADLKQWRHWDLVERRRMLYVVLSRATKLTNLRVSRRYDRAELKKVLQAGLAERIDLWECLTQADLLK